MTANPLDLDALEAAGIHVSGVDTRVTGSTTALGRPLAFGERVVLVVDAIVLDVGVKGSSSDPRLRRILKANDIFELAHEDGNRVVSALRQARREADSRSEEAAGAVLPGLNAETPTVDASGVVVTAAEKARLEGRPESVPPSDAEVDAAHAWAKDSVAWALVAEPDEYVLELDGISELEPWAVHHLLNLERAGQDRAEVLAALAARLDEELERVAGVEPWEGYNKAKVADIKTTLDEARIAAEDPTLWRGHLEHVARFEAANKARGTVIDYVASALANLRSASFTTELPPLPGEDGTDPEVSE